ncbi:MAG: hypothetical protein DI546_01325 [Rhizobium sp.]|nr:MAG: hypothetical protein DI546_01325 [Rhizobium sp.]
MNIETFPAVTSNPVRQIIRGEPRFFNIGKAWELRLVAEAYDTIGTSSLIISDALAFLVDRLVHGAEIDGFVILLDDRSDHSEVFIADHLVEDLREGCTLLVHAIAYDQFSDAPRILAASADHAQRACRRIYNQLRRY